MTEFKSRIMKNGAKVSFAVAAGIAVEKYTYGLREKIASGQLNPKWIDFRLGYWMGDLPFIMGEAVGLSILFSYLPKIKELPLAAQAVLTAGIKFASALALETIPVSFFGRLDINDFQWGGLSGLAAGLAVGYGAEGFQYLRRKVKDRSRRTTPVS